MSLSFLDLVLTNVALRWREWRDVEIDALSGESVVARMRASRWTV